MTATVSIREMGLGQADPGFPVANAVRNGPQNSIFFLNPNSSGAIWIHLLIMTGLEKYHQTVAGVASIFPKRFRFNILTRLAHAYVGLNRGSKDNLNIFLLQPFDFSGMFDISTPCRNLKNNL